MSKQSDPIIPEVLPEHEFVVPTRRKKRTVKTTIAGAHRGALAALDALSAVNEKSTDVSYVPAYVDVLDGRADAAARAARDRGLDGAFGITARIQDQAALVRSSDLVINHLDRADAVAASHSLSVTSKTPSVSYLAMLLPSRGVVGVACIDDHTIPDATDQIQMFFNGIAKVSARAGGETVFGTKSNTEHHRAESLIRSWCATHSNECLGKLAAGLTPTRYPIELTFDGDESIPLFVVESGTPATSLEALAESVLTTPHTPVPRGHRFVICEVLPDSLRFLTVRHKTLGGVNVTAEDSVSSFTNTNERSSGTSLLSLIVGVAVLANASKTNPIATTD